MASDATIQLIDEEGSDGPCLTLWTLRDTESGRPPALRVTEDGRPQLVEGQSYGYELTGPDTGEGGVLEPRELFDPDGRGTSRGRISTGNRVGLIRVSVKTKKGIPAAGLLEIVSSKLTYEEEFRWMVRDIAREITEASLARFAPAVQRYQPADAGSAQTLYLRFKFLQSVLQSEGFEESLNHVVSNPYVEWTRSTYPRPSSAGVRATERTLRALASGQPRRRMRDPVGALESVPVALRSERLTATTDNLPNQFVRFVLEEWRGFAQEVNDALEAERKGMRVASAPIARGLEESSRLVEKIESFLSTPVFRTVSRLSGQPHGNSVLQRRPGYREIVWMHQQSHLAASLTWEGGDLIFEAGQRDVATLYEYWVFLQVGRVVARICDGGFDYAGLFQLSKSRLQLVLKKNRTQVLRGAALHGGVAVGLELWFNRRFGRDSGESWTRTMRPDFSLRIERQDGGFGPRDIWLHLDAKYRVEHLRDLFGDDDDSPASDENFQEGAHRALREDLLKMHAYRDAIRSSSGAYVLYPGDADGHADDRFLEYHEVIPGLGAFVLRPTEQGEAAGIASLERFVRDVVAHVADSSTSDQRSRYWVRRSLHPSPVPSLNRPKGRGPVVGPFDLASPPADTRILVCRLGNECMWFKGRNLLCFDAAATRVVARAGGSLWAIAIEGEGPPFLLKIQGAKRLELVQWPEEDPRSWFGLHVSNAIDVPGWMGVNLVKALLEDQPYKLTTWAALVGGADD